MDPKTADHRAWALAPHLVVRATAPGPVEWMNPETGTTCRLDAHGEYAVLRRVGPRVTPVVAGQILHGEAVVMVEDPESVAARRAAAQVIVAVDDGTRR